MELPWTNTLTLVVLGIEVCVWTLNPIALAGKAYNLHTDSQRTLLRCELPQSKSNPEPRGGKDGDSLRMPMCNMDELIENVSLNLKRLELFPTFTADFNVRRGLGEAS